MAQRMPALWVLILVLTGFLLGQGASAQSDTRDFVWRPIAPVQHIAGPVRGISTVSDGVTTQMYRLYETGFALRVGDLNGDGWADVALITDALRLRVWMQDPNCHELYQQLDLSVVPQPRDLAIGDLDGDGDNDLVVVAMWEYHPCSGVAHIFLQTPTGLETTPSTYPLGTNAARVRIGDISSDGRADIVFASRDSLGALVQQPDGTYTNTVVASYETPNQPDVAIADLNNDNHSDIALLPRNFPATVNVYLQRTDGSGFQPGVSLALREDVTPTTGIAAGDVTGDGLADIMVTLLYNTPNASVVVFAQSAGGGFATPVYVSTYDLPENPTLADWNRDGRQDLIVLNAGYSSFSVHLQQAGGGLGPPNTYPVGDTQLINAGMRILDIGDMTGDGAVDVAFVSTLNGLVVATEGTMPDCPDPPRPPSGHAPGFLYASLSEGDGVYHDEIVAGDITGDGLQDFVAVENPYAGIHSSVRILPQQADGTFAMGPLAFDDAFLPIPSYFHGLSVGDVNGDGRLDIAAANNVVVIAYQSPDGTFLPTWTSVGTTAPSWTGIADWTGDGRHDVGVIADAWYVLPQQPDGTLGPPVQHLADQIDYTELAYMGDWNSDGRMDVYVWWEDTDPSTLGVRVLVQQTDGSFAITMTTCVAPTDFQMGDVTGDGLTDLVLSYERNAPWGSVWVLPQRPDGSIGERVLISAPGYQMPGGLVVGDLNANARQDVLVLNGWWYFSLLLQNEAGNLDPPLIYYGVSTMNSYYAHRTATIDANHDGVPEVIGVASPDQYLFFLKPLAYKRYLPLVGGG